MRLVFTAHRPVRALYAGQYREQTSCPWYSLYPGLIVILAILRRLRARLAILRRRCALFRCVWFMESERLVCVHGERPANPVEKMDARCRVAGLHLFQAEHRVIEPIAHLRNGEPENATSAAHLSADAHGEQAGHSAAGSCFFAIHSTIHDSVIAAIWLFSGV